MAAAVSADRILHRLVLADTAFGELQSEGKHLGEIFRRGLYHGSNFLLPKAVDIHSFL